jgi:hypothetical protein
MRNYRTGRIAVEGGDLQDAYDISVSFTDGNKTVATGSSADISGVFIGPKGIEVSWNSKISEDGFERDYLGKYRKGATIQVRLKLADADIVCVGKYTQPSFKFASESEIEFTIKLIGKQVA